ncbi:hypothetical protein D9M70_527090 [compost metagenome]
MPNTSALRRGDRVMELPEAKRSLPASIRSKVESCSTSEYIVRSSNGDSIRPHITALAMLPMPACRGPRFLLMRPASTSRLRKSIRWLAMPWVSSSGGRTVDGESGCSVWTMATIFAGSIGMAVLPMRSSAFTSGIGVRVGR